MKIIDTNKYEADTTLFDIDKPYYVTCDKYWDGGYKPDADLNEKCDFYSTANQFGNFTKKLLLLLNENVMIGNKFSEKGYVFEKWKNLKEYDSYNNLQSMINKRLCYELTLPDDNKIIDYIIENNFRYLSCVDFHLPKRKMFLQPTCHTELFIYSKDYSELIPSIEEVLKDFPMLRLKEYNCV